MILIKENKTIRYLVVFVLGVALSSCALIPSTSSKIITVRENKGGYYLDDGPPDEHRIDISKISNAIPQHEPLSKTGNNPYKVLGKKYYPTASSRGFEQTGIASWYGKKYHGRKTSSGEIYDMTKMTAAHPTLPLPSYVEVTNLFNNKKVVVKVNDRGPFLGGRVIDLSYVAAKKLGIVENGVGKVYIRAISPESAGKSTLNETISNVGSLNSYIIQVGAFFNENNANLMRTQLINYGYTVYTEESDEKLTVPYRVSVGPYQSLEVALNEQSRLKSLLNIPTLLRTEK